MAEKNVNNYKNFVERLPLEKFIPAAFLIFLLCFIVLSLITYNNIEIYKNSLTMIDHTHEILKNSDEFNHYLSTLQLKRRGYVVRLDSKYLEEYEAAKISLRSSFNNIKNLTSDNISQQIECRKLDSLSDKMIKLTDSTLVLFNIEKKTSDEQTRIILLSQDLLEECEHVTARIKENEHVLLDLRQKASRKSLENTQIFIISTSLFAFIVIGLSLFIFIRLIKNKQSAEILLKESYDELEERVEKRTSELKTTNDNLTNEVNNRIKIENSLRESEERFRVMADSAPVLIWVSGKNKRFTYVNKGWTEFTGKNINSELGNGWIENIHHDDLENCLNTYSVNFESRTGFEIEMRLRSANGEYRWFLNKAIPRYNGLEFEGFIGIMVDIHLKKRNERYLRIQYTVSKTLAESSSTEDALYKVLENICTGVNWKFGVAWVIEKEKLYQKAIWSENKSDSKSYNEIYDQNFSFDKGIGLPGRVWKENKSFWIENIRNENDLPRKEGLLKLGWNSAFALPISDNGKVTTVIECFNQDNLSAKEDLLEVLESVGRQVGNFLERKKAEESLKKAYDELENRVNERTFELANTLNRLLDEMSIKEKVQNRLKLFGHAIRGIKEGVFITDLQSKTVFVNPAFELLYGYIENEIIGKEIPVLYSPNISDSKRKEIISDALKTGWKGELINEKSDGSEFSVYLSASVIRDENGKVDSIVGIVQDITEEKLNRDLLEKRNSLLNLLNDIATEVNKIESVDKCIQFTIDKICEYTHWDIGHFLFYNNGLFSASDIWNKEISTEFDIFKAVTSELVFDSNEGVYKEIIEDQKPVWEILEKIPKDKNYQRLELCKKIGIQTCIWIPVISRGTVIGVLEFFNKADRLPDNEIIDSLSNIALELGSFTERNDFLELIKEREKHFKAIADTANDVIVTANSKGEIIYVNNRVNSIFGYETHELMQQDLSVLMPDNYVSRHQESFTKNVATGESRLIGKTIEIEGKKKNGTVFPIELSLAKWEMNDDIYFTGMIRDISLRNKIQNELLESRNSLLEAQTLANMGNWEWDVATGNVKWSDQMYEIYETSKETFTPTYDSFISMLHPESKEEVTAQLKNSLDTGETFEFYERILTPKGTTKILRSQGGVKTDSINNIIKLVGTCLDVTEIREAEEKIRKSEEQLSLILNNIKDYAIISLDDKGNITSWNKGAEHIKGYTKEEIIGKHISVFYTHDEVTEDEPSLNLMKARKSGRFEREGWRVRKDGTLFLADIIFTPIYGEHGTLTGYVKVTRDITERRQAEESIKESEKRLKQAQKIAKLGSWEWDVINDKVNWSDEMYNIFEVEPGTIITNDTYLSLLNDENIRQRKSAMEEAIKNDKPFFYYLKLKTKTGNEKILSSQGEIEKDKNGKIIKMVGTVMDVTLIKEAEQRIQQSEKQLKEAQSIAKLGSWEAEYKTGNITWSDELYRIHEFEPGEDPLDYTSIRKYIHNSDVKAMDDLIRKLDTEPGNAELDYRIITKSGRLKYLSLDLRIERNENNEPVRIYGSVQDITDIKLVEDELRKANKKLIEAQKELIHNEKLAALGRFSSGIAHEIRNPLANISALAQLVSKSKIEDEKMKKHLKYILVNSDIANKIIKDLLHFASPEDLVFDTISINEIVDNILNSTEVRCEENKVFVTRLLSNDIPKTEGDRIKLENAFMNFISNAIDAMPEGGNLKVKTGMDKIHNEIIIDIIDNGQGISPENLDKIFEPFFTTKETGTGLGLGLAYQTIKSHNGILNINSEPGKGTHVEIRIPVRNIT